VWIADFCSTSKREKSLFTSTFELQMMKCRIFFFNLSCGWIVGLFFFLILST
jgi:hypothetical protein